MFTLLTYPFIIRGLIAGVVLSALLAPMGVFVVARRMAFFGEGVAHASLAGIALALLTGITPLPIALLWAILVALGIYFLERSTAVGTDTIIGMLFTASMALGMILMSLMPGFQPELISYLFGSILTITTLDVIIILVSATIILTWLFWRYNALLFASLDPQTATISGINAARETCLFYVLLACSIVLSVKLVGIVLVSALLLIPAATSRLMTHTFRGFLLGAMACSTLSVLLGILLSFALDVPTGATVILCATGGFSLVALINRIARPTKS